MSERIAVYGGSFDPPHAGHVLAAAWVTTSADVDRLIFVPTFAHALGKSSRASYDDRVAMCQRLADTLPACSVSDIERTLPTPSRTLHTLEALARMYPDATLRLVVGADIANETARWYRWDDIVAIAPPLWLGRGGYERPASASFDFPTISSTVVRAHLAEGESVSGLVPNAVCAYIRQHDLYGATTR